MATAAAEAAALRPSGPDPLVAHQVAAALRSGDQAEAERLLRKRLLLAPNDPAALIALGDLAADAGKIREATLLLSQALALVPAAQQVRLRLSFLHQQQGHFPMAISLLQEVPLELRQSFELRAREAALLGQLGRRGEEIAICEELVAKQPRNAALWMTLGNALNYAGRRDDAVRALRKATKLKPSFGEPWWSLANLKRFRFDEKDLAAMQASLRTSLGVTDALHFHFALGRAFEERGAFDRSFDHYAAGNRLRAANLNPAQMHVTPFVDAAMATFTPQLFDRLGGVGCPDEGPIFVIGLQRSGSTLVEQILASHPDIEGTSELMTMQHLWEELGVRCGAAASRFPSLSDADPSIFRRIGEEYLARTRAYRLQGKRFFVDKLPANWMNVGLIRLALPNAPIIDARRHPMACGFSNFKQHYATGVTFAYSLESIGCFYRDYLRLMRHFDAVQPGAIHRVINERLIEHPEEEVRRMLAFIGLPFDRSCLDFHANRRAVHTPSAEQVRRPINADGVDHWRHYEPWLGALEQSLGPALDDWEN